MELTTCVDQYIEVAGLRTRYWQMGDRGRALILLHGGNGSIEFWLANLVALAQHHRVYAFDMFGCGLSSLPDSQDYSLPAQADFLAAFVQAMALEQVSLVGNSMGGGVALHFALRYPDRLERMILAAPLGWGRQINLGLRILTIPGLLYCLRPNRAMIPAMVRWNFAHPENLPDGWMDRRYTIFAQPHRQRAITALAQSNLNIWGVKPPVYQSLIASLPQIPHPTLVIWGDRDRVLPVQQAAQAQQLPQGQLEIWRDCGHHPFLEFPDRFNNTVLKFLADS
jgi:pimeloyl-ACP methyl ester carboxylesterase